MEVQNRKSLVFDEDPEQATSPDDGPQNNKTLEFDDGVRQEENQSKALEFDDGQSGGQSQSETPQFERGVTAQPSSTSVGQQQLSLGPADGDLKEAGSPDQEMGRFLHAASKFGESSASFFAEQLPKTAAFITQNTALGGAAKPPTEQELENQGFTEWLFGSDQDIQKLQESPLWQLGRYAGNFIDELFPENSEYKDEFFANLLPQAAGDFLGLAGTTALTGGSNLATGAILGASTAAPQAFEQAKKEGAGNQEAMLAFYSNLALGGLESIPIARGISRFNGKTNGVLANKIGDVVSRGAAETAEGALEEAAQESVTTFLNNATAKTFWEESRGLFDGVAESAAAGAILGGGMSGAAQAFNRKVGEAKTKQEVAELQVTGRKFRDQIDEAANQGAITQERADRLKNLMTYTGSEDVRGKLKDSINEAENQGNIDPETADKLRAETDYAQVGEAPKDLTVQDPEDVSPDQKTVDSSMKESESEWTQKFKNWMVGSFTEQGNKPTSAARLESRWQGKMNKDVAKAKRNIDEVERALQDEWAAVEDPNEDFWGSSAENAVPREAYDSIGETLKGEKDVSDLPERVQGPVKRMRNHVDQLSKKLIEVGAAEGEIEATIEKGLGVYLTRAYRKDSDNIDWELENIPEEIKTNAAHQIKKHWRRNHAEDPSEAEVKEVMEELTGYRESDETFQQAVSKSSLNWGPLKKREEFPQAIRALWGEYTDGTLAYAKTIEKVGQLAHGYEYYSKLRDVGIKEGWLVDPENAPAKERTGKKRIAPENSRAKEPIAGLRAEKPVKDAIMGVEDNRELLPSLEIITRINGGMKFAATVANQITHVRNFVGGMGMMMNQGHNPINPGRIGNSYETVKKDLGFRGPVEATKGEDFEIPDQVRNRLNRLEELELLDQSVRAGDLMGVLSDAEQGKGGSTFADRLAYHKDKSRGMLHSAHRMTRRVGETASTLYQAEDNMNRIMMWMAEADRYSRAMFDKPFSELEGQDKRHIERQAANLTKRLYQDYSRVPNAIKTLRRQPFMGTFVSFPYEVGRITYNTTRTALREINHSNSDVRTIGYKRLASQLAVTSGSVASAAATAMTSAAGVGLTEQEEKDVKNFVASWDREGALGMVNKDGMTYEFMNLSYIDSFNMIGTPVRQFAIKSKEQGPLNAIDDFAESMAKQLEPFYTPDLITQKLSNIYANENSWGGNIYNPADSGGKIAADVVAHFAESFVPQPAKSAEDVLDAYGYGLMQGGEGENQPDIDNALLGAAGFRVSKVDTEKSFEIQASKFADKLRQQRGILNEVKYDENASFSDKLDAMESTNQQYRRAAEDFVDRVDAIYRLGLSEEEIRNKMVDSGIPKDQTNQIIRGLPDQLVDMEDLETDQ